MNNSDDGYRVSCNNCERLIEEPADTKAQAKEIAAKYGWERGQDGAYYCPKCAFFMEAEKGDFQLIQTLILNHRFPALNEHTKTARGNKYASNSDKQTYTDIVAYECMSQGIKPVESAMFHFRWIEKNKRRNKDNIAFAKKYIFDGFVNSGIIKNDGWAEVKGFTDEFETGKEYCVIVEICEA